MWWRGVHIYVDCMAAGKAKSLAAGKFDYIYQAVPDALNDKGHVLEQLVQLCLAFHPSKLLRWKARHISNERASRTTSRQRS